MGIAGLTAWNVVRDVGRVGGEDRVLVLGASGGVGIDHRLARARQRRNGLGPDGRRDEDRADRAPRAPTA